MMRTEASRRQHFERLQQVASSCQNKEALNLILQTVAVEHAEDPGNLVDVVSQYVDWTNAIENSIVFDFASSIKREFPECVFSLDRFGDRNILIAKVENVSSRMVSRYMRNYVEFVRAYDKIPFDFKVCSSFESVHYG